MSPRHSSTAFLIILSILGGCSSPARKNRETLYQTSTIDALVAGVYDGTVSFKELKRHGDFGLGTFDEIDGEMIALDGHFYRVRADGRVYDVPDSTKTPFAAVTFFDPDIVENVKKPMTLTELEKRIDAMRPSDNLFYAIRIDGEFKRVKTRSVPRQKKPYRPLIEVVKHQPTFEIKNVHGVMVGWWCPSSVKNLNVPGYHLHFITDDRKAGGHVLDCRTGPVTISLDATPNFYMVLPETREFEQAPIRKSGEDELKKIEK